MIFFTGPPNLQIFVQFMCHQLSLLLQSSPCRHNQERLTLMKMRLNLPEEIFGNFFVNSIDNRYLFCLAGA